MLAALWAAHLAYPLQQLQVLRLSVLGWTIPVYYFLTVLLILTAAVVSLPRALKSSGLGRWWGLLALAGLPGLLVSGDMVWSIRQWVSFLLRGPVPGAALFAPVGSGAWRPQRVLAFVYPVAIFAALFGLVELAVDRNIFSDHVVNATIPASAEGPNPFYRPAPAQSNSMRPMGTQGNRIPYGVCLAAFLPYALWRMKHARRPALPGAAAMVLFAAVVLAQARSAWVGAAVGLSVAAVLLYRDRPRAILQGACAAGAMVLSAFFLPNFRAVVSEGVLHVFSEADVLRRLASYEALRMLDGVRWLTGVGYGQYPELFAPYYHGPLPAVPTPDNQYLRWFLETGLLGSAALAAFLLAVVRAGWRRLRDMPAGPEADFYRALLAGWAGIATTFFFFDGFYWGACSMTFWCLLGLFATCLSDTAPSTGR